MPGDEDHQPALPAGDDIAAQKAAMPEGRGAAAAGEPADEHPVGGEPMPCRAVTRTALGPHGDAPLLDGDQPGEGIGLRHRPASYVCSSPVASALYC
jgi:hypothetical protein